jgi:hypothetical protein
MFVDVNRVLRLTGFTLRRSSVAPKSGTGAIHPIVRPP